MKRGGVGRSATYILVMRKGIAITLLLVGLGVIAAAAAGPLMSNVEEPSYTVKQSDGPIELRAYPPLFVASTTVHGERQAAIREGFQILAGYIFGGNDRSQKIEMTAPVLQKREPVATSMTQATETTAGTWTVRFVMPRSWSLDTLPKATDERVKLTRISAATFAVIRFSGFGSDATLEAKTRELNAFIAQQKLTPKSSPIFAFYNPPWTLPFFRRNEIMIEV